MISPLTIGALIVAIAVLIGVLSVLKTTLKTAFIVAVVVFALQLLTGIGPLEVWGEILKWLGGVGDWFQNWGDRARPPSDFRQTPSPRSSGYNGYVVTLLDWLWINSQKS